MNSLPFRHIDVALAAPTADRIMPDRTYDRFPYVPSDPSQRNRRCYEAYNIQVQGLAKRLQSANIEKVVIGVSGGLDSTHALIVSARAMDLLGYPRTHILAYTMPGFATSDRTLANAHALMRAIGCRAQELDIRPSCEQMLRDLGHPYAKGEPVYDVTFENVQAGERTSHLFRLANHQQALVVGTGDLSELALGWCTYGVGDHMSHYSVNASVPKTLIQFLIRWAADTDQLGPKASAVLRDIVATEFSPELVPGNPQGNQPSQRTEVVVGPYALQDFNVYYTTRLGYTPAKIAFLAYHCWRDRHLGRWPDIPEDQRQAVHHWGHQALAFGVCLAVLQNSVNLNGAVCPMHRKSALAAPYHHGAITEPPAIAKPRSGCNSSNAFRTPIRRLALQDRTE